MNSFRWLKPTRTSGRKLKLICTQNYTVLTPVRQAFIRFCLGLLLRLMYYGNMMASGSPSLVELDRHASEPEKPYGIITVDCSSPFEYDDGLAVEPLPSSQELYRVSVFAVDGSKIYRDTSIVEKALDRTESRYDTSKPGPETYTPMLDPKIVRSKDFTQGNLRDALVVSFVIGPDQPPSDVAIEFGKVEVQRNFTYKTFGEKCRYREDFQPFGRAAALIIHHLGTFDSEEERSTYHELIHVPSTETWNRGANINQAYMIAANYLVARQLRMENALAIYRVHDPEKTTLTEVLAPQMAHFSKTPGNHYGLGLDVYTRVTSPLRRVEDLIMHGLLRARAEGRQPGTRDQKLVAATIQRLNQRAAAQLFNDEPRLEAGDLWWRGRKPQSVAS